MKRDEFIESFQQWRKEHNFPKREECREYFRNYRDNEKKVEDAVAWCEYVLSQDKPAMFLDTLFKRDGEISKLDKIEENNGLSEKNVILEECYNYIQANNLVPSFADISNNNARKIFETEINLLNCLKDKYQDLSTYILNEESFDVNYNREISKKIKQYDKFVITTAVSNKKVNSNFLNSLKNYCEHNDSLLLILPCADVANRRTSIKWQLDPELRDFPIIYNDLFLNENLMISDIKMSAKHINPLSGLQHLCQEKSVIIASTKQELEYVPNFIKTQPHACMTTGAITLGDYNTDMFMSKRTSKLAEYDHITGAIVVEIEDSKIFHFRQIQSDNTGAICDLGIIYYPDGNRKVDENICAVLGDLHIGEEDLGILKTELNIIDDLEIKQVVLHDIGSMSSISHWDRNKTITKAIKSSEHKLSLEDEANNIAYALARFENLDNIYIVKSNHHNFLNRWIENGDYAKDPQNLYYSLDIVKAFIEKKDPFEYMIKQKTFFKNLKGKRKKYHFLQKYESKKINGAEISLHGDRGANGSKGNDKIFNKAFESAVVAHTHTPKIYRGIYTVGTTSRKDLDYVEGLSTWGHSLALIYSNGSKQLINIIQNKQNELKWRL